METPVTRVFGPTRITRAAIGVGLLVAALTLPAAASAQSAESGSFMPRDVCLFLEENIADYDCNVPLAEYAGDAGRFEIPPVPEGANPYLWMLFWEENVQNFAAGGLTFAGDADAQPLFPGPDDVVHPAAGIANY